MKPGDLVRIKRGWMKGSVNLGDVPFSRHGRAAPNPVFQEENCLLLEVVENEENICTDVRVLTPRGTTGWSYEFEFEVVNETG